VNETEPEKTALQIVDGIDLTGKEAIVTGGTGGLGYQTGLALARAGARVVITGRDQARGLTAAATMQSEAANGPVVYRHLDLASQRSVTSWADRHAATGKPCHILVDNAGVMAPPLTRTEDGFELQWGVNHLGHFALTIGLLPCLADAGDARVVVLTSSAHRRSDVDFDDPNYERRPYHASQAYGQSKTANALFTVGLAQRYRERGITANAVMPGAVPTGLQRHLSDAERVARGWPIRPEAGNEVPPGWVTPAVGAATSVWAAVSPELATISGHYLDNCSIGRPWTGPGDPPRGHYLPYALDPDQAERLWQLSEQQLAQVYLTP
jgi:NAD(P)-dependent dehydrogenase (short-subunit alcohol dehydrogenase family)